MKRIPPSQKMRKKVEELLSQGLDGEGEITSALARLGMEWLIQELVEQQVTDYLDRGHTNGVGQGKSTAAIATAAVTPQNWTLLEPF